MNKLERIKQNETDQRFDFMMESVVHTLSRKALEMVHGDKPVERWLKPDGTHITEVDIALNKFFIEMVERQFPNDIVWGEELQNAPRDLNLADDRWVWSLDPIDSTRALVESLDSHRFRDNTSTILASATPPGEKIPVIGVVHSPFRPRTATAFAHDGGSYYEASNTPGPRLLRINRSVQPRRLDEIERFESSSWKGADPDLSQFGELIPYARKINHQLFIAAVALGDVDVSVFPGPSHPHDVAPGALIVHNAGGDVRTFDNVQFHKVDWREDNAIRGVVASARPELGNAVVQEVVKRAGVSA